MTSMTFSSAAELRRLVHQELRDLARAHAEREQAAPPAAEVEPQHAPVAAGLAAQFEFRPLGGSAAAAADDGTSRRC